MNRPPTVQSRTFRIMGLKIDTHPVVFPVSALITIAFVLITSLFPMRAMRLFDWLQTSITHYFGWLYILAMTSFLIFAIWLCFSRYGNIRLGKDDEQPEFTRFAWFSMLFSAGMGIGMLFFGVAEPLWHLMAPPSGEPQSLAAARQAMGITLFHWCLHPWALYSIVGICLAYFGFRKGLPLSLRSVFYPLLGDRIYGRWGNAIDILGVVATLFGLATSLGLGAKQINAGLSFVFEIPQTVTIQVWLIAIITLIAVASLVSGLHVGIKWLSQINLALAASLMLFLFIMGPQTYLLDALIANVGTYFQYLPTNSFRTPAYETPSNSNWLGNWTVFYWGWWIAWSPFVGMFIARVSRGRTIREFILGVMFVPSAVALLWLTVFGNSAIYQQLKGDSFVANGIPGQANARTYLVQTLDSQTNLPQTKPQDFLIAPHADWMVNPVHVLLTRRSDGELSTASGQGVAYIKGILSELPSGKPLQIQDTDRFTGQYATEELNLTLGEFLEAPVVDNQARQKIDTTATIMFVLFQSYPLVGLTTLIGTLCVIVFFVTSSDSASMVADIIASGGKPTPAVGTRIFWGVLEGCLAAILLLAGGLKALQTGAITIGLPFCLLILVMCFCLHHSLQAEFSRGGTKLEEEG